MPPGQCFSTCFVYEMQILWGKEGRIEGKIEGERKRQIFQRRDR